MINPMNTRQKIKLALTVGLLNHKSPRNVLRAVKELMAEIKEVGAFLGQSVITIVELSRGHTQARIALQYEHCTLDLDLVSNSFNATQVVQGFDLRQPILKGK